MNGLSKVRKAVADAAGWDWCAEHERPRFDGEDPCNHLHHPPTVLGYGTGPEYFNDLVANDE